MGFDLKEIFGRRLGENYSLHRQYVNPQLAKVLQTIGFDKAYSRAEGAYLYENGERYLDFLAGYGAFNIGRNHPTVKMALADALAMDLPSMVQMDCALLAGVLAEELIAIAPQSLQKVFFTNSGTEAVEGAIKLARGATGHARVIYTDHAFHGLTLGSLSCNGNEEFRAGFGELLTGTCVPFNDLEALERELARKDCAAFIVEPVQGKGVYIASPGYLQGAAELCKKYQTLLIVDEVQTSFGRTGKMFACEHWGVEPDIMTVAKSLSGGFIPVGAILMRDAVYEGVFTRMDRCVVHSTTFGRNSLAMAAGLATLHVLKEEKLVENAARRGSEIVNRLNETLNRYEMFDHARGLGLMMAVEFKKPRSARLKLGWNMVHAANKSLFGQMIVVPLMQKHKILSQVAGHHVDIVKLLPPLVIGDQEVDYFCNAFEEVVAACHQFPGSAWEVTMGLAQRAMRGQA